MDIKTKYADQKNVTLKWDTYTNNGNTALIVMSENGEMVLVASLNTGLKLPPNKMAVKDYSENEGVLDWLVREGIVKETGDVLRTGYVLAPIVEIIKRA